MSTPVESELPERVDDSDGESGSHHLLDDELVEMLRDDVSHEDPILTEYMGGSSGDDDDRTATAASWLPSADEMKDETFISPAQAKALAVGRSYENLFFETDLSGEVAVMNEIFDDFEKYLVSMNGMGRKEQVEVLTSMFGNRNRPGEGGDDSEATISLISNSGDGDE